jgi:hypothetical protein
MYVCVCMNVCMNVCVCSMLMSMLEWKTKMENKEHLKNPPPLLYDEEFEKELKDFEDFANPQPHLLK